MVAPGGCAWLLPGGVVAPGGCAWLLWGGMHGCSMGGGMHGCSGGGMVAPRGACVGYDEIRRYGQ